MTTIEYVTATALSLVMLVLMANVIVIMYARGAVRAALDEGVRAGKGSGLTLIEAEERCTTKAREVVSNLLRGSMGDSIEIECRATTGGVEARTDGAFRAWIPGSLPSWSYSSRAHVAREEP